VKQKRIRIALCPVKFGQFCFEPLWFLSVSSKCCVLFLSLLAPPSIPHKKNTSMVAAAAGMATIFTTLLTSMPHGATHGTVEVAFAEPCRYWIEHATLGRGEVNRAEAGIKYSIGNLPEGDYTMVAQVSRDGAEVGEERRAVGSLRGRIVEQRRAVPLYPSKPVVRPSYEWMAVPPGHAVPRGLEVRMDLGAGGNMCRIPHAWKLRKAAVTRDMHLSEVEQLLGGPLVIEGKRLNGQLTVEEADLFNRQADLEDAVAASAAHHPEM